MRIIDLLVKMANNEEVPKVIKYKGDIYKYDGETQNYIWSMDCAYDWLIGEDITAILNDEIEVIEEETTREQNFTGWKGFCNGKEIWSYDCGIQTLKPVDIVDVKNDIKEMLEEKPEKLEDMECSVEAWFTPSQADIEIIKHINKINNAINYLLNKVGDE